MQSPQLSSSRGPGKSSLRRSAATSKVSRFTLLQVGLAAVWGCGSQPLADAETTTTPPTAEDPEAQMPMEPGEETPDPSSPSAEPAPPSVGDDGRYVCDQTYGSIAPLRRLTQAEYGNAISDVLGLTPSEDFPASYGKSLSGYSTEPGINVLGEQGVENVLYAAEDVAIEIAAAIDTLLPCAGEATEACAASFLDNYGRRLFRRALTTGERDGLLAIYSEERADGATFAEGVAVMSSQLLQMPAFVYVPETSAPAGMDQRRSSAELGTRLALHFWNSLPDEELLDLALDGELDDQAVLAAQAERLFADPKSDRGLTRFFREWTGTTALTASSKDTTAFPNFDADLATSINGSFDRFVTFEVRSEATLGGLLRSNQSYVDPGLANLFGLPAVDDWTLVDLPSDRSSGLLTQPALLAALSHAADPSYVFRGKFVLTRLLCSDLGDPPGNAMAAFESLEKPADPTAKDLSAVVRSQVACGACHNLMDPAGLAFENFDALGAYRETYPSGKPIDPSGTFVGAGLNVEFSTPVELAQELADIPQTRQCFARQLLRYTVSRRDTTLDACPVQQIDDVLIASAGRLDQAFLETAHTDAFIYRRGE